MLLKPSLSIVAITVVLAAAVTLEGTPLRLLDAVARTSTMATTAVEQPTAHPQSITMLEDTTRIIVLTASNPAGQPVTFRIAFPPAHGTLSAISGTSCANGKCTANVTYTPNQNFNGADYFEFEVTNGTETSPSAGVAIDIMPVFDEVAPGALGCFNAFPDPYAAGWVKRGTQFVNL